MNSPIRSTPQLSLVVPAYQEEKRIGLTISSLSAYLNAHYPGAELIVVCDGCRDRTALVAKEHFVAPDCALKIIELPVNSGKGYAVKTGVESASGSYVFFTDADLSFDPAVLPSFLQQLLQGADLSIAKRSSKQTYPGPGRKLLAASSHFIVGKIILPGISDTQAGFKGFRREVAQYLFSRMKTSRFLFDLELLMMARQKRLRIEKVTVDWIDRPGSTVRLWRDSIRSLLELGQILYWRATGAYKLEEPLAGNLQKTTP